MEPEFVQAMSDWARSLGDEALGPGIDGIPHMHPGNEYVDLFRHHLPSSTCRRIRNGMHLAPLDANGNALLRDVWPQLTDEDVGLIMKAGAASFIRRVEDVHDNELP